MAETDDEAVVDHRSLTIDPEAIWATRISPDEIRVYLNEWETLTFTNDAAACLHRALASALRKERRNAGE